MKKVLMIIGGIVVGVFVFAGIIIGIVSLTSQKMKCKSSVGNITIMYNDNEITGYAANGVEYDLDGQKAIAQRTGVEAYLDAFAKWFEENSDGTCDRN